MRFGRRKKVGLALGGGAARGWAHLGVLRALKKKGIEVDYIAGTSIGSLVGAFMAAGHVEQLEDLALHLDWKQMLYYFFEVSFPRGGLVDGRRIVESVRRHMKKTRFQDLDIPLSAVATDVMTGQEVALREGDLVESVRASIAIPGIFTPVRRGEALLVDGGLVNPLPVSVVRQMGADWVIAVDLNHDVMLQRGRRKPPPALKKQAPDLWKTNPVLRELARRAQKLDLSFLDKARDWWTGSDNRLNILDVLGNSILIAEAQITSARLKAEPAEVLIRPAVGHISFMEFYRAEETMELGYRAAMAQL